jgi:hypothetical protein
VLLDNERFHVRPITGLGVEFLKLCDSHPPHKTNRLEIAPATAVRILTALMVVTAKPKNL